MTRSFRILFAAFAVSLAMFGASPASAGSVTLNDPNCDSFLLTGAPGSQALNCVISNPPVCSVQGPSTGSIGSAIALTAQCSPAATSWAWTGGACAGKTTSQCSPNESIAQVFNYTVQGTNAIGPGPVSNPLAVTWSSGPPPTPTGCVATAVPTPSPMTNAGGTVALNVTSCTPSAGLTYSWTKNVTAGFNVNASWTDTLPAGGGAGYTNSYKVTVCNGASCAQFPGGLLSVAVPGTGGGGGFDLSGCTAAGYTGRGLDVPFPVVSGTQIANGAFNASPGGTFGNGDALVLRFTTPAAGVNDITVLAPAGTPPSQNTPRVYTLSTQPCQFATSGTPTGSIIYATAGPSPSITINNKACPYNPAICGVYGAWTLPNTTYFLTMVNKSGFTGSGSCGFASCDMRIDFTP